MKNIFLAILIVCISGIKVLAAVPNWSVNPADYSGSMVMVGVISIDGLESMDENDMVGAFIGTEVRGVAQLQYEAAADRYIAYLIVYGNTSGGTLTFQIYDADKDEVQNAVTTATFQINGSLGNLGSPFVWSNLAQSSESELLSFSFAEAVEAEIVGTEVNVTIPYHNERSSLKGVFGVSAGASVWVENVPQVSGVTVNDFNHAVDYKVIAENGSDFTAYSINVSQIVNPTPTDIEVTFGDTNENNAINDSFATLVAIDDAADSHVFSFVSGSGDAHNSLFEISDNQILAKTIFDFESRATYTTRVKVMDSHLQSFEKVVEITVINVNEKPVLIGNSYTLPENSENGTTVATLSAVDPDGDDVTYSLTGGDEAFALDATSGVLTVANTELLDYENTPQFVLTATCSDGSLVSAVTIIVNLTNVAENPNNTAPVAGNQVFAFEENKPNNFYVGTVAATDLEGDNLTFDIISGNELGGFSLGSTTGVLLVADQTQLDFETNPSTVLNIGISDGSLTTTATITINLTDVEEKVNQAPTALDQTFTTDENSVVGFVVGTVVANDPDGDGLSYALVESSAIFDLNANTGAISILQSSALDFETTPSFDLQVVITDGSLSKTVTITIHLNDVDESINQAPQISSQVFALAENSVLGFEVGTVSAGDPDGDAIDFSLVDEKNAFSINANSGVLTVTDSALIDFELNSQFLLTVTISDGVKSASATVVINVTDVDETVNAAPTLADRAFSLPENSVNGYYLAKLKGEDSNGDELSYSISAGNELGGFSIESETGVLLVADQSPLDFETNPTFALIVEVSDGSLITTATITINLTDVEEKVNQAPTALDQTFTIDENSVVGFVIGTVVGNDPDGDGLSYELVESSAIFDLNANTGAISILQSSALDFETTPSFDLQVVITDGSLTATVTITIHLNDVDESINQAPQISSQVFALAENSVLGFEVGTVSAGDPDGDAIVFSLVDEKNAFSINAISGVLTVTDSALIDFELNSQFLLTVTISDGVKSASATVVINVTDVDETVNAAPTLADRAFSLPENSVNGYYLGKLKGEDSNGDELSYSISAGNELGGFSIESETGVLLVADQSPLDFETNPTFALIVEVSDGLLTSTATLSISLTDLEEIINQAPMVLNQSFAIDENSKVGTVVGKLTGSDPDGDMIIFSLLKVSQIFTINAASGEIIVLDAEAIDYEKHRAFTLEVVGTDGSLSASARVTITINDLEEDVLSSHEEIELVVYPNPVIDRLMIRSAAPIDRIECYDLHGAKRLSSTSQEIDVRSLNAGTYILYVHQAAGMTIRKFLKR